MFRIFRERESVFATNFFRSLSNLELGEDQLNPNEGESKYLLDVTVVVILNLLSLESQNSL